MKRQMLDHVQPFLPLEDLVSVRDGTPEARMIYNRHYSARRYRDGRSPKKLVGPGEYLLLTTPTWDVLVAFRLSRRPIAGQSGVYLSVFRNESIRKSSEILRQALRLAENRWPDQNRVFTLVDPRKIESSIPGYCFRRAGFRHIGDTKSGQMIFSRTLTSGRCPCA
jgi:hypothetical protein